MQWGKAKDENLRISPFQQKLIFAENEFVLACCGRASGKTSGVTGRMAYRNVNYGRSAMLIAPTFGLIRETIMPATLEWFDKFHVKTKANLTEHTIETRYGKIVFLSGTRPDSPRGYTNLEDFYCDEGSHEVSGKIITVPWEKNLCLCSGASWGWMANDPVQPLDWLIRMLVNVICRDGNILWNIAPDKNGKLSPEIRARIAEFGAWIKAHAEAIYGTRGGPLEPVDGVYGTTFSENRVYLHVLDRKAFQDLALPPLPGRLLNVQTLDNCAVPYICEDGLLRIDLSCVQAQTCPVLRLTLDCEIKPVTSQVYFTGKG